MLQRVIKKNNIHGRSNIVSTRTKFELTFLKNGCNTISDRVGLDFGFGRSIQVIRSAASEQTVVGMR